MSWLRVVTYQLPDHSVAKAVEAIKAGTEQVVRILEERPGFGGAYWGESPADNTVSAISHWSSLEAIQSAEGAPSGRTRRPATDRSGASWRRRSMVH